MQGKCKLGKNCPRSHSDSVINEFCKSHPDHNAVLKKLELARMASAKAQGVPPAKKLKPKKEPKKPGAAAPDTDRAKTACWFHTMEPDGCIKGKECLFSHAKEICSKQRTEWTKAGLTAKGAGAKGKNGKGKGKGGKKGKTKAPKAGAAVAAEGEADGE